MTARLTDRQRAVLAAIDGHTHTHGYPPSYREIGAAVGLSAPAVAYQIGRLVDLGRVARVPGTPRTLTLTKEAR
jgi:repressor LexA